MIPENLHHIARQTVATTLLGMPPDLRHASAECRVEYATAPEPGEDPDLLGLFSGFSRLETPPADPTDIPSITLYLENLWQEADENPAAFEEEVRITFLHELGHYLGLDEADLEQRGLE